MDKELKILMVEDVQDDAELVRSELKRGGLRFSLKRVEESDRFRYELDHCPPDLVFSDHGIPSFDGFSALAMTRTRCPEVPFIFVTGSLGEELTIRAFENGAMDCVLKHRLTELVPAVKRALRESDKISRLKAAEAEINRLTRELRAMQEKHRVSEEIWTLCSACKKVRQGEEWRNLEHYLHKRMGLVFSHGICPECVQRYYTGFV